MSTVSRWPALLIIGLLWTGTSAQSPRPPASDAAPGSFRGRIVAASNGDALPRARVAIAAEGAAADAVLTDDRGRFSVPFLRPSDLTLTITKAGYAARRVRVARKDVTSDDPFTVRLEIGAAVSGRVARQPGRPAVAMTVTVRRAEGDKQSSAPAQWVADTDDRGEYRVGGLPAGRYTVAAGQAPAMVTTTVTPKTGDDVNGVNLVLDAPAPPEDREDGEGNGGWRGDPAGNAALEGRVLGDLGEPLAGARIRLMRHGMNVRTGATDANGQYSLNGIPEGRYVLHAANPGYVAMEYGQRRSTESGRALHLRDDENLRGVDLVLPRGAAVTGNVVDEHGEAVEGAVIRALQVRFVGDRFIAQHVPGVSERRTDDRGHYRLFGLLPGSYLVTATIDAAVASATRGKSHGYAPTYYPGTAVIGDAWSVQVDIERDVHGAHIVLAPSPAVRVSGTVLDSQGKGFKGLMLLTTSRWSRAIGTEPRTVPVNGTFVFNNVPPGDYALQATPPSDSDTPTEFVAQYVRVMDRDVSVSLVTSPGAALSGYVLVEGGSRGHAPGYSIVPVPADLDLAPLAGIRYVTTADSRWRIGFLGLHGPMRFVLADAPRGWYLKLVTIDGFDATDVPYDFRFRSGQPFDARIVISPHGGTVRGRVTDDRGAGITEYTVIVFADERTKWYSHSRYTKFARPAQDDSFEVTGLPPGNYRAAAVRSLDATAAGGDWQNPAMLEKLAAGAQRVSVGEGDLLDVTLRIVSPYGTRN